MTVRILLDEDQLIDTTSVSTWSMGLFRMPAVTITCGYCANRFKTRDLVPFVDEEDVLIAKCPECKIWNVTGLYSDSGAS